MTAKITLKKDGAIRIEGDFEVYSSDGQKLDLAGKTGVSLCRCAGSKNMPWCDGAHKSCGFCSDPTASNNPQSQP